MGHDSYWVMNSFAPATGSPSGPITRPAKCPASFGSSGSIAAAGVEDCFAAEAAVGGVCGSGVFRATARPAIATAASTGTIANQAVPPISLQPARAASSNASGVAGSPAASDDALRIAASSELRQAPAAGLVSQTMGIATAGATPRRSSRSRSCRRALASRPPTVPAGQPSSPAASSRVSPCRSQSMIGVRKRCGSRSISCRISRMISDRSG